MLDFSFIIGLCIAILFLWRVVHNNGKWYHVYQHICEYQTEYKFLDGLYDDGYCCSCGKKVKEKEVKEFLVRSPLPFYWQKKYIDG